MRSVFIGLIIIVLAAGFAAAENKEKPSKPSVGFKKEKVVKLRGGLYTKMYIQAYYKTKKLELDKEQRKKLNRSAKEHVKYIMSEENKSRVLQKDFINQLERTPFDSPRLKKLALEIMDTNTKVIDNFIAGMAEIEKIIGPADFAKLAPISKFDRSSLVQLRQSTADNPLGEEEVNSEEPGGEAGNN